MSIQMCRYMKRYEKLINYYRNNIIEGYIEKHHILPLSLGGDNSISNLVALPPRAHYLAHYFLWKANPSNQKLALAFAMMGVNNPFQHRVMNGKLYEISKIARSNAIKGKKLSEETKQKMRKPKCETHRLKLIGNKNASGNKGKKLSPRNKLHTDKLVVAQRWYHEKKSMEREEKVLKYRKEFLLMNLTRKEFAEKHSINYTTMKKYLTGL